MDLTILPDGTKFSGKMVDGKAEGLCFSHNSNGCSQKGYFHNGELNGIGYRDDVNGICIGFWKNNVLSGWGIKYYNKEFTFGYWTDGNLTQDLSSWMYWIREKMGSRIADLNYTQNLIQFENRKDDYMRWGIPGSKMSGIDSLSPGDIGFEFHANGVLYIGEMEPYTKYFDGFRFDDDGNQIGVFNNDKLIRVLELENYQSSEYIWSNDGMFAKKKLHTPYDDLPF